MNPDEATPVKSLMTPTLIVPPPVAGEEPLDEPPAAVELPAPPLVGDELLLLELLHAVSAKTPAATAVVTSRTDLRIVRSLRVGWFVNHITS
jgi:hypothetical protein